MKLTTGDLITNRVARSKRILAANLGKQWRRQAAGAIGVAPNRVSELVAEGVIQPASTTPLRFLLNYNRECYADYQVCERDGPTSAMQLPKSSQNFGPAAFGPPTPTALPDALDSFACRAEVITRSLKCEHRGDTLYDGPPCWNCDPVTETPETASQD